MSWHADIDSLDAYLSDRISEARAASVEAHLFACDACRAALARRAGREPSTASRHESSWNRIVEQADRPRLTVLERLLVWCRVPPAAARLVAAAPALRQAWVLAGTALMAVAVIVAHIGPGAVGTVIFVITAPVVPLIGVGLSYGSRCEPAGEVAVVAPYRSFRLVLLRTLVVLGSSLPAAAILALALPSHPAAAVLWFIPALALCSLTLAASTYVDPLPVTVVLVLAWLTVAGLAVRGPRWWSANELLDQFFAFRPAGQVLLGGVALGALAVAVVRRSAFDSWRAS
jgi:hypothetical protein